MARSLGLEKGGKGRSRAHSGSLICSGLESSGVVLVELSLKDFNHPISILLESPL